VLIEQWNKGRIIFVVNKAPRSKGVRGSGGRATGIVIIGTRWR